MINLKPLKLLLSAALLLLAGKTPAHDAWIEGRGAEFVVLYGHGEKTNGYAPAKVKAISAVDAQGMPLSVEKKVAAESLSVTLKGRPVLVTLHFDNGYWSKTTEGTKNLPRNEAPGALSAMHSVKFGKTILAWEAVATRPQGLQLEIVPLSASAPQSGKEMTVQVLWEGKPLAGAKIVHAEYGKKKPIEADAEGKARVPVVAGRQMLGTSHKLDLAGDPRADTYSVSANLVFEAR